jgi:release factor glutamine methyltransferase
LTTLYPDLWDTIVTDRGVYAPQHDSRLLIEALAASDVVAGRRAVDLCSGTGVVAIAAAQLGAAGVTAYDICPRAVRCSRNNVETAGVAVDVRLGTLTDALSSGPWDLVMSNPPYVPVGPSARAELIPAEFGSPRAWNAGRDGRLLLDPLCALAAALLSAGGTMLIVQSEFAGVERSLATLRCAGLDADVVARQSIPLGPVLSARAAWLERIGLLSRGEREEQLAVIRADKR